MTKPDWIDPKISIGNIVQILVVIAAVIGGYFNLRHEIAANTFTIDKVDTVLRLELSHIRTSLDGIATRLGDRPARNRRSDRLPGPARLTP